jgi:hypothetical protein
MKNPLYIGWNHIFHVEIWQKIGSKRNTNMKKLKKKTNQQINKNNNSWTLFLFANMVHGVLNILLYTLWKGSDIKWIK